jgi:hypothetical protein
VELVIQTRDLNMTDQLWMLVETISMNWSKRLSRGNILTLKVQSALLNTGSTCQNKTQKIEILSRPKLILN